jgi:poly(3-hydroxybutyrate) depolymerase
MQMNADERGWPQMKGVMAAIVLVAASLASAWAATPIPDGRWRFQFIDRKGQPDRPIDVYTYRPRRCDTTCPIVFVLPGVKRNASDYLGWWELKADKYQFLVVAPSFSQKYWPRAAAYNLGDLADQADREKWAYSAIEHLFDEVRDGHNGYAIFGHSAGGQFVQRMALFRPDNRATVMVAANPGWYTMPVWQKEKAQDPFPFSLVGSRAGEAEVRQALARRFILMAGEKDDDPNDENLNNTAGAKRQGESRIERAENFFMAATTAASTLGIKLGWELIEVPDTGHDGEAMSHAAAEAIFGRK